MPTSDVKKFFLALASLRLTVVLMAMSIFLVFVGTLAQKDHDIWFVVEESYFRVWLASVEWQVFYRFIELFTKAEPQPISGGFLFPGGKLIGTVMAINLLAAHSLRFKVTAKGQKLATGLALLSVGVLATAWVIMSGMDDAIESQLSSQFCEGIWQSLRALLAGAGLVGAYWAVGSYGKIRATEWWLATSSLSIPLFAAAWLYANPETRIDDAGLRILWQLAKGGISAAVLFAGCYQLFNKRAGIVLLHSGIGLLMIGELLTGMTAEEGQMVVAEGETTNFVIDSRESELAITTTSQSEDGNQVDKVTVIPEWVIAKHAKSGQLIANEELPFDLKVKAYYLNSRLMPAQQVANQGITENLATFGAGQNWVGLPVDSVDGVSVDGGVNLPCAYVELIEKPKSKNLAEEESKSEKKDSLGTWLVSAADYPGVGQLTPQPVAQAEGAPTISMRFKRTYKPYSVTLKDFRFDRYVGTQTPKNYSSSIVLKDPSRGVDRDVRIWMNNPLRYAGDTLYQASFDNATETTTVLQVVTNRGWMIPYVSCMLVGLGMLTHFGISLGRFAQRRQDEATRIAKKERAANSNKERISWLSPLVIAPAIAGILCAGYLASKARPADNGDSKFNLQQFGQLPVAEGGRVKPIDSFARITLQYLSERQEVLPHTDYNQSQEGKISATQWLLESMSGRKEGLSRPIFRIVNVELLELLGLPARPGYFRYSYDEIMESRDVLAKQIDLIQANNANVYNQTLVQKKTLALAAKLSIYHKMVNAFGSPRIGFDEEKVEQQVIEARRQVEQLNRNGAVRVVMPSDASSDWKTLFESELLTLFQQVQKLPVNPASTAWSSLVVAYANDDAPNFNLKVVELDKLTADYEERIKQTNAEGLALAEVLSHSKIRFEHFFQNFSPFYYCAFTYLVAFFLTALSWLGWPRTLGRSATTIILVTLLVHTFAVVARVYISSRPPVTNLYSSAIFIGWAAVLFGIGLEAIYRIGVGNAVASILGFSTLVVAHQLSLDGDTFTVMQAVLDTQFWLATHVVCITIGYSTTFLAGFLAIAYLIAGHFMGRLDKKKSDQIIRMTYGTLCFALFFSFIGTVLGGLWADDSWGRFWGWDPKENGALIIVLWNALVLHARWGKMVGPTGLATLAVAGNIATAWSWFGVNELSVGLHAYGFTEGRAFWLLMFMLSQLAIILLGCLPIKRNAAMAPATAPSNTQ